MRRVTRSTKELPTQEHTPENSTTESNVGDSSRGEGSEDKVGVVMDREKKHDDEKDADADAVSNQQAQGVTPLSQGKVTFSVQPRSTSVTTSTHVAFSSKGGEPRTGEDEVGEESGGGDKGGESGEKGGKCEAEETTAGCGDKAGGESESDKKVISGEDRDKDGQQRQDDVEVVEKKNCVKESEDSPDGKENISAEEVPSETEKQEQEDLTEVKEEGEDCKQVGENESVGDKGIKLKKHKEKKKKIKKKKDKAKEEQKSKADVSGKGEENEVEVEKNNVGQHDKKSKKRKHKHKSKKEKVADTSVPTEVKHVTSAVKCEEDSVRTSVVTEQEHNVNHVIDKEEEIIDDQDASGCSDGNINETVDNIDEVIDKERNNSDHAAEDGSQGEKPDDTVEISDRAAVEKDVSKILDWLILGCEMCHLDVAVNGDEYSDVIGVGDSEVGDDAFLQVKTWDDSTLAWPREMVMYTRTEPRLSYSVNPMYFDFSTLLQGSEKRAGFCDKLEKKTQMRGDGEGDEEYQELVPFIYEAEEDEDEDKEEPINKKVRVSSSCSDDKVTSKRTKMKAQGKAKKNKKVKKLGLTLSVQPTLGHLMPDTDTGSGSDDDEDADELSDWQPKVHRPEKALIRIQHSESEHSVTAGFQGKSGDGAKGGSASMNPENIPLPGKANLTTIPLPGSSPTKFIGPQLPSTLTGLTFKPSKGSKAPHMALQNKQGKVKIGSTTSTVLSSSSSTLITPHRAALDFMTPQQRENAMKKAKKIPLPPSNTGSVQGGKTTKKGQPHPPPLPHSPSKKKGGKAARDRPPEPPPEPSGTPPPPGEGRNVAGMMIPPEQAEKYAQLQQQAQLHAQQQQMATAGGSTLVGSPTLTALDQQRDLEQQQQLQLQQLQLQQQQQMVFAQPQQRVLITPNGTPIIVSLGGGVPVHPGGVMSSHSLPSSAGQSQLVSPMPQLINSQGQVVQAQPSMPIYLGPQPVNPLTGLPHQSLVSPYAQTYPPQQYHQPIHPITGQPIGYPQLAPTPYRIIPMPTVIGAPIIRLPQSQIIPRPT